MDNSDTQATLQVVLDALKENREEMREAQKAAANAKRDRRWTMVLCLIALIACLGDSEFLREIEGRDQEDVFHIMDDLMDTLQVANPRVYNGVMRKIRAL